MLEAANRGSAVGCTGLRRPDRRLEHAERDLEERLAGRVTALGSVDAPVSDPLYQRLFFVLAGLRARRAGAEDQLFRRAGGSTREEDRPAMKSVADSVDTALDAGLGMTFLASDPVAISTPGLLRKSVLPATAEDSVPELYQALKRHASMIQRDRRLSGPSVRSVTVHDLASGSRLTLDAVFRAGALEDLGYRVRACSLGQAATAIVVAHAQGLNEATARNVAEQLQAILVGRSTGSDWPELEIFALAQDVPNRHESAMLPFRALEQLFKYAKEEACGPSVPATETTHNRE